MIPLSSKEEPQIPRRIALPCSSTRIHKTYAHCKLITKIGPPELGNIAFEGKIYPPGATLDASELGEHPVVIECVGPVEKQHGHKRSAVLWILWGFDWKTEGWRELARATASNWEWILSLRRPAMAALYPRPKLYDVRERGAELAGELAQEIATRLDPEPEAVRINVYSALYDRLAGRIAQAGHTVFVRMRKPPARETRRPGRPRWRVR